MELDSSFSVVAPIDTVWAVLMDFDRVAGAVPGAEILNRLSDDALQVGMKVKLGPVSLQYKGLVKIDQLDDDAHRAVFSGKAQETRGQGAVEGSATLSLSEAGGTTTGTVHAELTLTGKAAAMGRSIIDSVTKQMVGLFASNLQAIIEEEMAPEAGSGSTSATATAPTAGRDSAAQANTAQSSSRPASSQPAPPRPAATRPASSAATPNDSLDAMSIAQGVIADQLRDPVKLGAVLVGVGVLGYLIGRRRGRRVRH
ncbi:SRPBCC family protein [Leifsonia sp. McL0607]|uniref:SRPBCC family protein n=1 Tax=Leifsonia sp. McL0607 TaxID=3415672 RepID=UPI003CF01160